MFRYMYQGLPTLQQPDITATVLKMKFKQQLQIEKLHPNTKKMKEQLKLRTT